MLVVLKEKLKESRRKRRKLTAWRRRRTRKESPRGRGFQDRDQDFTKLTLPIPALLAVVPGLGLAQHLGGKQEDIVRFQLSVVAQTGKQSLNFLAKDVGGGTVDQVPEPVKGDDRGRQRLGI